MKEFFEQEITHYLSLGILPEMLGPYFESFVTVSYACLPTRNDLKKSVSSMNQEAVFQRMTHITFEKETGDFIITTNTGLIRFIRSSFEEEYKHALETGPALLRRMICH